MSGVRDDFRRVLVVDDHRGIQADFARVLASVEQRGPSQSDLVAAKLFGESLPEEKSGFELVAAYQGRQGLTEVERAVAAGRPFGMAFIDVRMPPGWNGIETAERIRQVDPLLPIVICTAYSDFSVAEMSQRLGGNGDLFVLKKPFDAEEVLQLAQSLCHRRSCADQADAEARKLRELVETRTREVEWIRHTDELTQLQNRDAFIEAISASLERLEALPGRIAALFVVDIDGFRKVNDSLGHEAGNALLREAAGRLKEALQQHAPTSSRDNLIASRLCADEFAFWIENLPSAESADEVADHLVVQFDHPFVLERNEVLVTARVGLTVVDGPGRDAEDLLRRADTAVHYAKRLSERRVLRFESKMHREAVERIELENALRQALIDDTFEFHIQPIVSLDRDALSAFEVLVRWRAGYGKYISPAKFISVADETGLIVPLGQRAVLCACRLLKEWRSLGWKRIRLSVNVSRHQLGDNRFPDFVAQSLQEFGIPGNVLGIEVTETGLVEDDAGIADELRRLQSLGCPIYLDDFGTGLSSLSTLHQLPVDVVKIDRSFISGPAANERRPLVESIVTMSSALGLEVVAEGIETPEQLDFVRSTGCRYGQGFLLGRPVRPDDLVCRFRRDANEVIPDVVCFGNGIG